MTAEDARRLLAQEQQQRFRQCWAEIQQVLTKYGLRLRTIPRFTPDGRVDADVALEDLPTAPPGAGGHPAPAGQ